MQRDYRVTVVFDYSVEWDYDADPGEPWVPDIDVLHDAIRSSFDTVDLEFTENHPLYDENGDELDGVTCELAINADAVREVEVVDVTVSG